MFSTFVPKLWRKNVVKWVLEGIQNKVGNKIEAFEEIRMKEMLFRLSCLLFLIFLGRNILKGIKLHLVCVVAFNSEVWMKILALLHTSKSVNDPSSNSANRFAYWVSLE